MMFNMTNLTSMGILVDMFETSYIYIHCISVYIYIYISVYNLKQVQFLKKQQTELVILL